MSTTPLWSEIEGRYVTEASTIGIRPFCPKCRRPLGHPDRTDFDGDGDVLAWHTNHACGAKLTIYND